MKIRQAPKFETRKDRQKFYQSSLWRKSRDVHLLYNPDCVECGKPANAVDHKVDIYDAPELALEPSNFQSLCTSCHSKKTTAKQHGNNMETLNKKWNLSQYLK